MKLLIVPLMAFAIVAMATGNIFRSPTAFEMDKFLLASPVFPQFQAPLVPPLDPQQRVDFGVGLPGGRFVIFTQNFEK
jgi:hypothetical protein